MSSLTFFELTRRSPSSTRPAAHLLQPDPPLTLFDPTRRSPVFNPTRPLTFRCHIVWCHTVFVA